jgi:membrane protease YdiL (CAAX protease family)
MNRRLAVYFPTTFLITWGAWGSLLGPARAGTVRFPQPAFLVPFILGGIGPAIAAYLALFATRDQAPQAEFHQRLFRWRLPVRWYLATFGIPIGVALAATVIGGLLDPGYAETITIRPWYLIVPLIGAMVLGGGLEELGWRGMAQAELETTIGRQAAAPLVGLVWAVWHLPLFWLPGVGQYQTNFALFTVGVIGGACQLAWLYGNTRSILLCVLFHATWNAISELGFALPSHGPLAVLDAALRLAVGLALLTIAPPVEPELTRTGSGAV